MTKVASVTVGLYWMQWRPQSLPELNSTRILGHRQNRHLENSDPAVVVKPTGRFTSPDKMLCMRMMCRYADQMSRKRTRTEARTCTYWMIYRES